VFFFFSFFFNFFSHFFFFFLSLVLVLLLQFCIVFSFFFAFFYFISLFAVFCVYSCRCAYYIFLFISRCFMPCVSVELFCVSGIIHGGRSARFSLRRCPSLFGVCELIFFFLSFFVFFSI